MKGIWSNFKVLRVKATETLMLVYPIALKSRYSEIAFSFG